MTCRKIVAAFAAACAGSVLAALTPCTDYVSWKPPAVPQPGTPQHDAVAAAYAFRTPDRAATFATDWDFATAVYGRDYSRECPPGIVVVAHDAVADPQGRGAAMQRLMDALEPGDLVVTRGTNGIDRVLFYAGDVYGDRHGCALYPHRWGRFIVEHTVATLVNWPAVSGHKLRVATAFRLLRPLKDPAIRLSERRAFPKGVAATSADARVQAVLSLAWARYLKGPCLQYDSRQMVNESVRKASKKQGSTDADWWRNDYRQTPEEATADRTGYTVCSVFPYEVYWELFRYGLGDDTRGVQSFNLTRYADPAITVYRYDRRENRKPAEQVLKEAWDVLEPGDVISYARVYEEGREGYCKQPGGHVMLYVGEVDGIRTMLHSGGQKFEFSRGYDQFEYDGTMLKDDLYGANFAPGRDGTIATSEFIKRDQFVILRPLLRADLTLTPSGRARAKLPKFRYDRRVKGGLYGSVVAGEALQYGVEVFNAARTACDATVVETLPEGTEFISASKGCAVEGRKLTWPIALGPGESRVVSWRVKVTAEAGARIVAKGGRAGGIPSNTLETEVVPRTVTAEEALAWAERHIARGRDLPDCRVRGWAGGRASDTPPRAERVHETRSRDLTVGDVVLSIPKRGADETWRLWVKGQGGLFARDAEGRLVRVPEREVTALMCCDAFWAFRPAADRAAALPFCRAVADAMCTFTAAGVCGKGIAFAEFTLASEPGSEIRCRIELPPAERWNGELWGVGNSSSGGKIPKISGYSAAGLAAVTTDLGTEKYVFGAAKDQPVPRVVIDDFFWRATHLMTVYAKKIVRAHYGRDAAHAYFRGGSCGGRQGLSEAQRFPEDYDGILVGVPAATAVLAEAEAYNVYCRTHDADGRELVTREQLRLLADAAIDYMADREPKPYAGKVLANPFLSDADIDGFLAHAAKKDPALAAPALRERLKGIYTGVVRNGKRVCHGMPAGAFLGNARGANFTGEGRILMRIRRRAMGPKSASSWEDFERAVADYGAVANATSLDLSAFRDRGGKLIMTTGWEDQTIPASDHIAWYEAVAAAMGGFGETQKFFRLFPLPGLAHGGGKGRIATGGGIPGSHVRLIRDWVTKGVAPAAFPHEWKAENLTIPVPPYPLMAYQDDAGRWQTRRYPENLVRKPDPAYLASDPHPGR